MTRTAPSVLSIVNHLQNPRMRAIRDSGAGPEKAVRPCLDRIRPREMQFATIFLP